jgi:hypothetical protein
VALGIGDFHPSVVRTSREAETDKEGLFCIEVVGRVVSMPMPAGN